MAQLAIKGFIFRGYEVIRTLEMLGGKNTSKYNGEAGMLCYYIDENGKIECDKDEEIHFPIRIFTLDEFLEKFPYKVGDKVIDKTDGGVGIVDEMHFEECNSSVIYGVTFGNGVDFAWCSARSLQPYKEETMDKANKAVFDANAQCCDIMNEIIKKDMEEKLEQMTLDIPDGYEFFGIDDDNKIVLTKKQPQYPKTYEGCCKIKRSDPDFYIDTDLYSDKLGALYKLLICRDAYWKLAGDWKPDWTDNTTNKYIIHCFGNGITKDVAFKAQKNSILSFPTEEMRDAFYENFKEYIENCKELL